MKSIHVSHHGKLARRKWKSRIFTLLLGIAVAVAILPLASVLVYVIHQGFGALNLDFFTQLPKPVGEVGGGMVNAIFGSVLLIGLASFVGVPVGVATGIYLSEYAQGKLAKTLRFAIDNLTSIPSIITGLFAYALLVMPMKRFSAHAGGVALAVIMIPIVARTTEELLKLVPQHIREAGLALGIPRWKVILSVVVRGSLGGISTGIMLAVARAAGETAPLLFTAFNNQFAFRGLDQPVASLPVQIYTYAISPYEDWHQKAWAGSLVLVAFVLALNLFTRLILRKKG